MAGSPSTASEPGGVKNALMNVGSGPIIYQLLGPCKIFKEITASDYRDWNCQELQNWLKNELESDSGVELENWAEKEANLSRIIKQVLKCDLHKSNSLDTVILLPTDSLVSSLCLEAACKDLKRQLVLSRALGCSFYMIDPKRFSSLVLREEFLREALSIRDITGWRHLSLRKQPSATTVLLLISFHGDPHLCHWETGLRPPASHRATP
uniref:Uncharacterized protein n=1 Tax=Gopherus agassizii TaxID=38772 RepID=A0A452IEU7_9SAUR